MKKWEYMFIICQGENSLDDQRRFNQLGQQGWEMVGGFQYMIERHVFFKREIH